MSVIRLPSGVRDFLPRAATRRRELAARVMTVFETWGFQRIVTPMFEVADVLERGLGDAARAAAIRFVEPGTGEIVALRPDITPQIARVVATRMAEVSGPIRLCYEGAIMRLAGERGQHEIVQAGIELIDQHGDARADWASDVEVISVAAAALAATGIAERTLDLGHVAPARYVLAAAPAGEARAALVAALTRKDRASLRVAARALPADVAVLAEALGTLSGPADATLARARALSWPEPVAAALAHLASVIATFRATEDDAIQLSVDLADLRGEGYYTGMRFAGYVGGAPDAVLRGGRYDELLGRYGHAAMATGFAIDLEAVAQALPPGAPSARGVAIVEGPSATLLARGLRERGIRAVVVGPAPDAAWLAAAGLDLVVSSAETVASIVERLKGVSECPS